MFKKTIKYTDYNGVERTEDFYFNLTKAELMEMELSTEGGMAERMKKITNANSTTEIVKIFKDLVLMAYGEKSSDGRFFKKSEEIRQQFECSPAYSIIFMELATDVDAATAFINEVIPSDIVAEAE